MAITKDMREAYDAVKSRFQYSKDGSLDKWRIMKEEKGPLKGDCEDFSLTILWHLSDKSMTKFWWNVTTGKGVIWYVRTEAGVGHAILHWNGMWADNKTKDWTEDTKHRKVFPMLMPLMLIKMGIGKL